MSNSIKDLQLYNDLCEIEEILRRDGWCQGELRDAQGRHCLVGVIDIVTEEKDNCTVLEAYDRWWKIYSGLGLGSRVAKFNDLPTTRFKDVLARIKAARDALI